MLHKTKKRRDHFAALILSLFVLIAAVMPASVHAAEIDGIDVAKKIPIIAMTANAFDEDVQRSLQVGMNAHLSKPVEPDRLYQTLEELIWDYDQEKENDTAD
ncbi:MAG: response regulator [Ruminococcaceae bacterium]|nr:response regulator [Oscillospiraceae bacterium]